MNPHLISDFILPFIFLSCLYKCSYARCASFGVTTTTCNKNSLVPPTPTLQLPAASVPFLNIPRGGNLAPFLDDNGTGGKFPGLKEEEIKQKLESVDVYVVTEKYSDGRSSTYRCFISKKMADEKCKELKATDDGAKDVAVSNYHLGQAVIDLKKVKNPTFFGDSRDIENAPEALKNAVGKKSPQFPVFCITQLKRKTKKGSKQICIYFNWKHMLEDWKKTKNDSEPEIVVMEFMDLLTDMKKKNACDFRNAVAFQNPNSKL